MAIFVFSQKSLLVTHSIFLFSETLMIHLSRILFMSFQIQRAEHGSQHRGEQFFLFHKTSQWAVMIGTSFLMFCLTPAAVLESINVTVYLSWQLNRHCTCFKNTHILLGYRKATFQVAEQCGTMNNVVGQIHMQSLKDVLSEIHNYKVCWTIHKGVEIDWCTVLHVIFSFCFVLVLFFLNGRNSYRQKLHEYFKFSFQLLCL